MMLLTYNDIFYGIDGIGKIITWYISLDKHVINCKNNKTDHYLKILLKLFLKTLKVFSLLI